MKPPSHPQEYAAWKQEHREYLDSLYDQIRRRQKWYKKSLLTWAANAGKRGWTGNYDQLTQVLREYLAYLTK